MVYNKHTPITVRIRFAVQRECCRIKPYLIRKVENSKSKTRKYIRILCVILYVVALLTSAAGCSRKSNKNEKVLKQIINNPDSYPQLSFAEFNTLINGKSGLSAAELPRDKACDTGDNGYDFTRYIVGGEFIYSCYINSKKPDQSMYSLSYFENGSIVDEVYGLQKFPDFLNKYGK